MQTMQTMHNNPSNHVLIIFKSRQTTQVNEHADGLFVKDFGVDPVNDTDLQG